MKNYYEILEVSEKASKEIIEKAFKVLAKKYHPDMNLDNPKEAAERFKEVSEAYEILCNDAKRAELDEFLRQNRSNAVKEKIVYRDVYKGEPFEGKSSEYVEEEIIDNQADEYEEERRQIKLEYEMRKAYNDAYIKSLKDMGYKIIYKKSFKDYLRGIVTLIILLFIIYLLYIIPFTHNYFEKLIMQNEITASIVNIIKDIFERVF
jgi:curved DNA-binding protein CbpA